MLSKGTFDKLTGLGLSQEVFLNVTGVLFEAVEETANKLIASFSKQIVDVVEVSENKLLAAVKETEEKIFARMAQEAAELEEKKRLRREAIAARKAAKALEKANEEEGVAVKPDARFQGEKSSTDGGTACVAGEDIRECHDTLGEKEELDKDMTQEWTPDMEGYDPEIAARKAEEAALRKELEGLKEGDLWKDGAKILVLEREYNYIFTQRDKFIQDETTNRHFVIYNEAYKDIMADSLDMDTGKYLDPEMTEQKIIDMAYHEAEKQAGIIEYNFAIEWDRQHGIDVDAKDYAPRPPNGGWEKYGKNLDVKNVAANNPEQQDDPLKNEFFEGLFPECYGEDIIEFHKGVMRKYLSHQEMENFCHFSREEKEWLINNLVCMESFPVEERLAYIEKMMNRAKWDAKKWAEGNNIASQKGREAYMARASYEAALRLAKYDLDPAIQERLAQIEERYLRQSADDYDALIKTPEGKRADAALADVVTNAM